MSTYVPPSMRSKVTPDAPLNNLQPTYTTTSSLGVKPNKFVQIDTASTKEFPSLGTSSTNTTPPVKSTWGRQGTATSFADMAKAWANKDEEDRVKKEQDEERCKMEEARQQPLYVRRRRYNDGRVTHIDAVYNYPTSMADEYEEERHVCTNAHNEDDNYDDNNDITSTTSNPLGIYQDDFKFH